MLTVTALMKAKPGKEGELRGVLEGLIEPTHKEEGFIDYVMHESQESQGSFLFYENWTSREALDAHLKTPHLTNFLSQTADLLDGEVKLSFWSPVKGKIA